MGRTRNMAAGAFIGFADIHQHGFPSSDQAGGFTGRNGFGGHGVAPWNTRLADKLVFSYIQAESIKNPNPRNARAGSGR